ncbi:MAG: hypothetical protein EOO25_04820 [Comamonadaceae bacterium]|nr:MAG: hypothetical protein EOO25_04820 [Comamonadaceae bacterium]
MTRPTDALTRIQALSRALDASVIETHISWVLLDSALAYKIKKPLKLEFVDYSTLEARRHFCEEEVRLNRKLAPSLYIDVASITGSPQAPVLDGDGPAQEYAVRMRRFAPGALCSERMAAGLLEPSQVDALAQLVADFHATAAHAAPTGSFGDPAKRAAAPLAVLRGLRGLVDEAELALLHQWFVAQSRQLAPLWAARRFQEMVRECHGDLHLANVVFLQDRVAAFDCIEFDPALRWIDVLDDAAFTVMDFAARGRPDYAFRFLNGWLDRLGDHDGLPALRFALAYRAVVRALAERLRGPGRAAQALDYLRGAIRWATPAPVRLTITHGLPGSGKTFQSQRLLERDGAVRLRSDVERKRLAGLPMLASSRASGQDLYTQEGTARTYAHLLAGARTALDAGFPVILDAAFLRRSERDAAHALAREVGVPFSILACDAAPQVLRQRLQARTGDASEADGAVLAQLVSIQERLQPDESAFLIAAATRDHP